MYDANLLRLSCWQALTALSDSFRKYFNLYRVHDVVDSYTESNMHIAFIADNATYVASSRQISCVFRSTELLLKLTCVCTDFIVSCFVEGLSVPKQQMIIC